MKRELGCFFCQELIPLQAFGKLDAERVKQVKSHVESCRACKIFQEQVNHGLEIVGKLKVLEPSQSLEKFVSAHQTLTRDLFQRLRWRNWPPGMRWTTELAGFAIALVLVVEFFPWNKLVRKFEPLPQKVAEVGPATPNAKPSPPPKAQAGVAGAPEQVAKNSASPAPTPVLVPSPKPAETSTAAAAIALQQKPEIPTQTKAPEPIQKGYIYRGEMTLNSAFPEPDTIRLTIESLGGEKAGQVRLGWKQQSGRYYHFTMPENKYEVLVNRLKAIGDLRIRKEPHPRVMPRGVARVILTVEEPGDYSTDREQTDQPGPDKADE